MWLWEAAQPNPKLSLKTKREEPNERSKVPIQRDRCQQGAACSFK